MIFDTDVLIWFHRGNAQAARLLEKDMTPEISIQSYMEYMQGVRSFSEMKAFKTFLHDFGFKILPITESVSYKALTYIEEYSLSCGLRVGDALIAATASENHQTLISANHKHFKLIKELKLHTFHP